MITAYRNFKITFSVSKLVYSKVFLQSAATAAGADSRPSSIYIVNRLLHDTVKKRILEARTKIKSPKYVNDCYNPNDIINQAQEKKNNKAISRQANYANKQPKKPESAFKLNNLAANKRPPPSSAFSKVLPNQNCPPPPCPSPCPSPCPPPPCPPNNNFKYKLLGALLAACGFAGFVYYWNNSEEKCIKGTEKACSTRNIFHKTPIPMDAEDIPKNVPYLLIGGGTASFSAFRAIKSQDPKAKVLVISNEFSKPYMRPPLSKELWYNAEMGTVPPNFRFKQWNGADRSLFYEPDEFYINPKKLMDRNNGGVAVLQGYTVKKIDPSNQTVTLTDGTEIIYEKCLIATGCSPKNLEIFSSAPKNIKEKVSVFRNPSDFEELKRIADTKKSITIIGSGFLGSELACALSNYGKQRGLKIYQIFHETGNMAKVLPEYLSKWTTNRVEIQGVYVIQQAQISNVSSVHNNIKLTLSNGQTILTDHVVVCTGCEPNTDIAVTSGLETDSKLGGFVVNAELEARRNLFVAGDAACFYDPLLGRRRVEHHDHSVVSGRLAGENMTGQKKPYKHQSMFWSDLGPELGYEGIGMIDSTLNTVGVFAKLDNDPKRKDTNLEDVSHQTALKEPSEDTEGTNLENVANPSNRVCYIDNNDDDFGKGVIFYIKDDKIVGILLWNIFNRISIARQIINENRTYDDLNEVAKLFEIHA